MPLNGQSNPNAFNQTNQIQHSGNYTYMYPQNLDPGNGSIYSQHQVLGKVPNMPLNGQSNPNPNAFNQTHQVLENAPNMSLNGFNYMIPTNQIQHQIPENMYPSISSPFGNQELNVKCNIFNNNLPSRNQPGMHFNTPAFFQNQAYPIPFYQPIIPLNLSLEIENTLRSLAPDKPFCEKMKILTHYPSTVNRLFESYRQFTNQTSNFKKKLIIDRRSFDKWTNEQGLTSLKFNLFKNQYSKLNSDQGLHYLASKGFIRNAKVIELWPVIKKKIPDDLDQIKSIFEIDEICNKVKVENVAIKDGKRNIPKNPPIKMSKLSLHSFKDIKSVPFIDKKEAVKILDILNYSKKAFGVFSENLTREVRYKFITRDKTNLNGLSAVELVFFNFYVFTCLKKNIRPVKIESKETNYLRNYILDRMSNQSLLKKKYRTDYIGRSVYINWISALEADYDIYFDQSWDSLRTDLINFVIYPNLRRYLEILPKGKWGYVRKWKHIEVNMDNDIKKNANIIFDQKYFESISLGGFERRKRTNKSSLKILTKMIEEGTNHVETDQGLQTKPQKLNDASINPVRIDQGKQTEPQSKDPFPYL